MLQSRKHSENICLWMGHKTQSLETDWRSSPMWNIVWPFHNVSHVFIVVFLMTNDIIPFTKPNYLLFVPKPNPVKFVP